MACTTYSAQGASLYIARSGSPADYVEIGSFKSWSGFDGQASEIDATCLSSTAKEKVLGLQDFGNFTANVNAVDTDAGQAECKVAKTEGSKRSFRLTLQNGKKREWEGYVKSFTESGGVDAIVESAITIMISGPVSYTA